jgi:hypothetical protein
MLKLYLYGYLQGIRSSRKLERETHRNLEVIWLIEGLRPSYKSIADFRKSNSTALKGANRDFILLCKELALLGGEDVAVDGSFFKADASKAGIYTETKLNKQLAALEQKLNAYQQALAEQDAADDKAGKGSLTGLGDAGYYDGEQIKTCEEQGIQVYVESKAIAKQGRTTRDQFCYDAEQNTYTCPQGQALTAGSKQQKDGKTYIHNSTAGNTKPWLNATNNA